MSSVTDSPGAVWRLAAITFVGGLGGGVVFPIIPIEGLRLGISAALIGLILSLNRISRMVSNPFTGILVDRFGPRVPLTLGLLVEACATLSFNAGLISSEPAFWFMLGRVLWGIGSSLIMVGALTAALLFSTHSSRGMASAKVRMGLSFGVPGGLILGGLIADLVSSNAAFLTASAITLIGMVGAYRYVPSRPDSDRERPRRRWSRRRFRAGWLTTLKLLRPGPLWFILAFNFLMFFSVQGVILASLVVVVEERGLSVAGLGAQGSSGLLMAVMIGTSAMVSLLIGRRLDRRQRRAGLLVPAVLLLISGYAVLALADGSGLAAVGLCLVGIGLGGINIPLMVMLGDITTPDRYGRTIGIYQVMGDLGGSLGPITGLAAIRHFGSTSTLLAITAVTTIMLPLALIVRHRELVREHTGVHPSD